MQKSDDESDLAGVPLDTQDETQDNIPSLVRPRLADPNVELLHGQPLVQYDGDPLDVDGSPLENENNLSNESR